MGEIIMKLIKTIFFKRFQCFQWKNFEISFQVSYTHSHTCTWSVNNKEWLNVKMLYSIQLTSSNKPNWIIIFNWKQMLWRSNTSRRSRRSTSRSTSRSISTSTSRRSRNNKISYIKHINSNSCGYHKYKTI